MTFGQRLKGWRRRRFLTQKELAQQIPVALASVQRWEADQGLPYPASQRRLIDVLGVTPEEFFAALEESAAAGKAVA